MKAHFIGICGAGMSAVAKLLKDSRVEISGSDEGFYPPVSDYLTHIGLPCIPHYAKDNIPADADFIVIGKHAKLIPEENVEVKAALLSGKPIKSFPEVLSELTALTHNIVVAGSFGKSTCTSLIAWTLQSAGKDPSFFIGAVPKTPDVSSKTGNGDLFVLEGDEYPTSNWDMKSKFLYLNAHDVLLTSLTHDHVNVFPTIESYLKPFETLIASLPTDAAIVACKDSENLEKVLDGNKCVTYSVRQEANWTAKNIAWGEITSFDLYKNNEKVVRIETRLLGIHNIENIVGVGALLLEKAFVTPQEFAASIRTFEGLTRRLDLKSEKTSVKIYEGFGSSYAKAESAIAALKQHFPKKRLLIAFEPHTFSWRNREALPWYDTIFKNADMTFVYKPPTHGANTHEQLTLGEITARIKNAGQKAAGFELPSDGLTHIEKILRADDAVLLLTSGDLGGLIAEIPKLAEEKFPA
jgi:UDP-N-acetylmuramate: L-alanyl-gamma-D-glutamyl-meso-diaminopimelate ligase